MADAHAPGPWVGNTSLVIDARGFPVATVHPARDVKPAAEAKERNRRTAALITAAPELLEALKTARSILVDVEGWDTTWPNIQDIDAVIAKAEGAGK